MKQESQYNLFGEIQMVIEPHRHRWKEDKTVPYFQDKCKCGQKNHIKFIIAKGTW